MAIILLIEAWSFFNDHPVSWIGAQNISGLWTWNALVNERLAFEPVWHPLDPNGGGRLCMMFYFDYFADEYCISAFAAGVFCEHYNIPLFNKHS